MAIDEWLLDEVVAGRSGPVLRLYRWARPTLSLGFHQRELALTWREALAQRRIALVRRPSGGRAVLHAGCLTYALLWPHPPADRRTAYRQASEWLCQAWAAMGRPLRYGQARAGRERGSCFASSTAADLVEGLVGGGEGKRIGSAQLWRRGHLLQHGSLLLTPPVELWRELFGAAPPELEPLPLEGKALEGALRTAAEHHLCGGQLWERPLGSEEWAAIGARRDRYLAEPA